MGRHNNREKSNTYQTERQKERELDKLRKELIKKPSYEQKNRKKNFVKKQK